MRVHLGGRCFGVYIYIYIKKYVYIYVLYRKLGVLFCKKIRQVEGIAAALGKINDTGSVQKINTLRDVENSFLFSFLCVRYLRFPE